LRCQGAGNAGDLAYNAVIAFTFFQGCSRACEHTPRHSLNLAIETFVSRATSSSGSPRNSRATIAILR
jgi:hypothetical protein